MSSEPLPIVTLTMAQQPETPGGLSAGLPDAEFRTMETNLSHCLKAAHINRPIGKNHRCYYCAVHILRGLGDSGNKKYAVLAASHRLVNQQLEILQGEIESAKATIDAQKTIIGAQKATIDAQKDTISKLEHRLQDHDMDSIDKSLATTLERVQIHYEKSDTKHQLEQEEKLFGTRSRSTSY